MEVEIYRVGESAFLRIGDSSIPIKGYKISSSMHDGTELDVTIQLDGEKITQFAASSKTTQRME